MGGGNSHWNHRAGERCSQEGPQQVGSVSMPVTAGQLKCTGCHPVGAITGS